MNEWDVTFREIRRIVRSDVPWKSVIKQVVTLSSQYPTLFNYPDYWDRVKEHNFSRSFEMVTHWAEESLSALVPNVGWEFLLLDLGDCPETFRPYCPGGQTQMSEEKLRDLLSQELVGADELETCLVPEQENSYVILFGEGRRELTYHNVRELDDEIISWNHTTNAADWPDNNAYLLWFAIGSQALLAPLRNPDDCRRILQGRDKIYLLSGFEEIFTYIATVTPNGLIYEYKERLCDALSPAGQQQSETNDLQGIFLFELSRPYGWEPSVAMNTQNEPNDEEALLTRETCHPRAAELLKEPFYFDCTDEFSPHGNDTGADTLALFRTWRTENTDASPLIFLDELLASWGCMNAHWDDIDSVQIQKQIQKDEFGLLVRDDTVIGLAFAQFVVEGIVDDEIKRRALLAIDRQALPAMIEFRAWTLPRQRLEKLALMRAALEVALESDPPNLPQREERGE